jgi:hypothetical protein
MMRLADRIAHGPIPVEDALPIVASQGVPCESTDQLAAPHRLSETRIFAERKSPYS